MKKFLRKSCSLLLAVSLILSANVGLAWADDTADSAAAGGADQSAANDSQSQDGQNSSAADGENGAGGTDADNGSSGENGENGENQDPAEKPFSGPMTLEYAMEKALANNSSVLEASINLDKAEMDKEKIDSDAEKFYKKVGKPTPGKIDQTEEYYKVLVYAPAMAEKQLEMAQEAYNLAVSSTMLSVITQYFTIANYGKTEVYTVKAYNNAINSYNTAKAKYGQGMIAKIDLMTAELQMSTARQTALTSRVNTTNAKRSLMASLGMDPNTEFSIATQMTYLPLGTIDTEKVVASLIENSPAVNIAKITYDIAGIQYECDSRYYLDFTYTAQVALNTYKNAENSYKQTQMDAKANAYNMVETLQDAERQYNTALAALDSVNEGYRVAKLQYQYGLITYNDVLMAEAEIYSTEAQINGALMQYSIYKTALDSNLIVSK